jgi:hypothetical protein
VRVTALVLALFVATAASASVSVRRSPYKQKTIDVYIVNERLTTAVASLETYLPFRVQMLLGDDPVITVRVRQVSPEAALNRIVAAAGVELKNEMGQYWISDNREPSVTLDVKDAEVREILKSMKLQCGIKNLIIDPNVSGTGTFMFTDVPCKTAFNTVFRSLGLAAETYPNSVITVGKRK